jgi:hypothetical protein
MDNKKFSVQKSKKYLIAFVFVMLLNIGLGAFLLNKVLAQKTVNRIKSQPPIEVEVLKQNDSPLQLTIINIDNSNQDYQAINYLAQNNSNKSIRAYVVLSKDKTDTVGAAVTRRFFTKLFKANTFDSSWFNENRGSNKLESKLYLLIDYVEFEDGSSWGNDVAKQSEFIAGSRAGWKEAVKQSRELLKSQKTVDLINFLRQEITETNLPFIDPSQTDKWQRGYRSGYQTVISTLRERYEQQGLDSLSTKLEEMEKLT